MYEEYRLEWLDTLTTVSLNPTKTDLEKLLPEQITNLRSRLEEEKTAHRFFLNKKAFGLLEEKKIQAFVNQYHAALVVLLDQALENKKRIPSEKASLGQLVHELILCLNELIIFIETRFFTFLNLNERASITCLSLAKQEVKQRLAQLKPKLENVSDGRALAIVLKSLHAFTKEEDEHYTVTFKEILYRKELLNALEVLAPSDGEEPFYNDLNELLIYMNFNSKRYKDYLTQRVSEELMKYNNIGDKIDNLLFHFKELNQMLSKPGIALNPGFRDLKADLSNWFTQEILYWEKKLVLTFVPFHGNNEQNSRKRLPEKEASPKLLCNLSVDQMALVLRSATDLKIINGRSLNNVFKTIVPSLSSPNQEHISWDSMRSKSYNAESRDKAIVVQALKQMIAKIKEY